MSVPPVPAPGATDTPPDPPLQQPVPGGGTVSLPAPRALPYTGPPEGVTVHTLEKPVGPLPAVDHSTLPKELKAVHLLEKVRNLRMCQLVAKVTRGGGTKERLLLLTGDLVSICMPDASVKRINHVADLGEVFYRRDAVPEFVIQVKREQPICLRCKWQAIKTLSDARYYYASPPSGLRCTEIQDTRTLRMKAKILNDAAPKSSNVKDPAKQLKSLKDNPEYGQAKRLALDRMLEEVSGAEDVRIRLATREQSMGIQLSESLRLVEVNPDQAGDHSGATPFINKRVTHVAFRPVYNMDEVREALQGRGGVDVPLKFADAVGELQPGEDELVITKEAGKPMGLVVSRELVVDSAEGAAVQCGGSAFVGRKIVTAQGKGITGRSDLAGLLNHTRVVVRFAPPEGYQPPPPEPSPKAPEEAPADAAQQQHPQPQPQPLSQQQGSSGSGHHSGHHPSVWGSPSPSPTGRFDTGLPWGSGGGMPSTAAGAGAWGGRPAPAYPSPVAPGQHVTCCVHLDPDAPAAQHARGELVTGNPHTPPPPPPPPGPEDSGGAPQAQDPHNHNHTPEGGQQQQQPHDTRGWSPLPASVPTPSAPSPSPSPAGRGAALPPQQQQQQGGSGRGDAQLRQMVAMLAQKQGDTERALMDALRARQQQESSGGGGGGGGGGASLLSEEAEATLRSHATLPPTPHRSVAEVPPPAAGVEVPAQPHLPPRGRGAAAPPSASASASASAAGPWGHPGGAAAQGPRDASQQSPHEMLVVPLLPESMCSDASLRAPSFRTHRPVARSSRVAA